MTAHVKNPEELNEIKKKQYKYCQVNKHNLQHAIDLIYTRRVHNCDNTNYKFKP